MNDLSFEYTKKRRQFGLPFSFQPSAPELLQTVEPNRRDASLWTQRYTTSQELDCIKDLAERKVGTEAVDTKHSGMFHDEGGFGKEVNNPKDATERKRALERYKGPNFSKSVIRMVSKAIGVIEQNNAIDLYQDYFLTDTLVSSEPPSLKTHCVLKGGTRSASNICWLPDGSMKLAVSYSVLQFQKVLSEDPFQTNIWDLTRPNEPDQVLTSPSPCVSLSFNPKSVDWMIGGLYNGLVAFWDVRKGNSIELSSVEHSHADPVYDVAWIQSRTNQEFCSVSTDGYVKWWDIKKINAPMDAFAINDGGISLEYRIDAGPNKFLIGTESGEIISLERKPRKDAGSIISVKQQFPEAHCGPVYSIKRNPNFPKYFLSIGDWTTKVWCEDIKQPILINRFESSYLTSACWSPTRPGVFITTKMDGTMDVWDIFYKLNEPVLSYKLGDQALSCISFHIKGKMVAVGSVDGTVTVLELSESLTSPQNNEKSVMSQLWDRETKREKHLENLRSKKSAVHNSSKSNEESNEESNESAIDSEWFKNIEQEFMASLGSANQKLEIVKEETEEAAAENMS